MENYPSEGFQGKEVRATLRANSRAKLQEMLEGIQAYATEHEMEEITLLKPITKDPDGGFETVVDLHNLNILSWTKEKWSGRGGGLEARIKREQEAREKQLKESKLRAEAAKEKARQLSERATLEREWSSAEKTMAEKQAETRQALQARRRASAQRRRTELGMRLDPLLEPLKSMQEGVRRVGGFAGAQAATFETALYTPSLFAEEATTPVRPKRPQRPLLEDIMDSRMP